MTKAWKYEVKFHSRYSTKPTVNVATTDETGDDVIKLARIAADVELPDSGYAADNFDPASTPVIAVARMGSIWLP